MIRFALAFALLERCGVCGPASAPITPACEEAGMTRSPKSDSDSARKPLTAERLRELVNYDPETGAMTARVSRPRHPIGTPIGTKQPGPQGRLIARMDYGMYYVHRLAWLWMAGAWPAALIDHINGDPLDNRWCNLREATYEQNSYNRRRSCNGTSGHKDVHWFKPEQVWRVILTARGRDHFIGRFRDKAEAVAARDAAVIRLNGEFARLD